MNGMLSNAQHTAWKTEDLHQCIQANVSDGEVLQWDSRLFSTSVVLIHIIHSWPKQTKSLQNVVFWFVSYTHLSLHLPAVFLTDFELFPLPVLLCFLMFSQSSSLIFSFITFSVWQRSYTKVLEQMAPCPAIDRHYSIEFNAWLPLCFLSQPHKQTHLF